MKAVRKKQTPRLEEASAGLLVVDLQERFAPVIHDWTTLLERV